LDKTFKRKPLKFKNEKYPYLLLTTGTMDYIQNSIVNDLNYPNHVIDMNVQLACGCYDKNGNWRDISYVQYVHTYWTYEISSRRKSDGALSKLELKFDGQVISRNSDHGFEISYKVIIMLIDLLD